MDVTQARGGEGDGPLPDPVRKKIRGNPSRTQPRLPVAPSDTLVGRHGRGLASDAGIEGAARFELK